jgi:hypothetical protein
MMAADAASTPVTSATAALSVPPDTGRCYSGRQAEPGCRFSKHVGQLLLNSFSRDALDERELNRPQKITALAREIGHRLIHMVPAA